MMMASSAEMNPVLETLAPISFAACAWMFPSLRTLPVTSVKRSTPFRKSRFETWPAAATISATWISAPGAK